MALYRNQRENVSLLRSEGHASASRYTLAFMWNEVRFVRKRINGRIATDAVMMNAVIAQAFAGGEHLKNLLEKLQDGE